MNVNSKFPFLQIKRNRTDPTISNLLQTMILSIIIIKLIILALVIDYSSHYFFVIYHVNSSSFAEVFIARLRDLPFCVSCVS